MITTRYIDVAFGGARSAMARALYQYDYGQILRITDLALPFAYEVHFSDKKTGNSVTMIGNADGVEIPDACLLTSGNVYCWFYLHDTESDGETRYEVLIPILSRAKPTNAAPTPVQQDVIDQAIAALDAAVQQTGEDVIAAGASASAAAGSASDAEAWAVGERDGEPVESSDLTYHNNSKYYAGEAASAAQTASQDAQTASDSAIAAGNAKTAAETAQGKAETAQEKAEAAQTAAEDAADQTALDVIAAADSADEASGYANTASGYASTASGYAIAAQGHANDASGYASSASGYATNAYNSAQAAAGSVGEASGYASSASGYASAANDAKIAAQGAQTAAETAQGLAEAAKTGAESAQTAAESARDAAIAATEDKAPVILDSASGAIVSIIDGANGMNARSLVAAFSPIQDLHGYENPWPAGGGKNVFKCYAESDTVNGITFIVNADGTMLANGTATADVIYTLSRKYEESPQSSYCHLVDIGIKPDTSYVFNGSFGGTSGTYRLQLLVYGSGAEPLSYDGDSTPFSFNESDVTDKWYRFSIRVFNGTTLNNVIFKPMIRLASVTDDSYAPYSNICPISGRTGVTAYRTGKNLIDGVFEQGAVDYNGSTTRIRLKHTIPVFAGITYTLSASDYANFKYVINTGKVPNYPWNSSVGGYQYCGNASAWVQGSITFTATKNGYLGIIVSKVDNGTIIPSDISGVNIQLELGSTASAYEPYSGTTYPVTFPVVSANQWDEETELGSLNTTSGLPNPGVTNQIRAKNFIPVTAGQTYRVVCRDGSGNGIWMLFYDSTQTVITEGLPDGAAKANNARRYDTGYTVTIPDGCAYICFYFQSSYGTTYLHDTAINYPSTVTYYESHDNRTVYGGSLDIKSGTLTVNKASIDMGALNWVAYSSGINTYRAPIEAKAFGDSNLICSAYKTEISAFANMTNGTIRGASGNTYVYVRDNNYTDATSFTSGVTGQTIVYELSAPQTYQLTPTQVQMLLGVNNVWATGDTVDLTYPCDTKLYMERLTEPTEDDMVANAIIPIHKFFMIGNSLYYSTAAIAQGAAIVVGTNCTALSLADALNALN